LPDFENVTVTGGAGLIGSWLVEQLVARGVRVTVIDDYSRGRPENLERVAGKFDLRLVDLEDPAAAARAFDGTDAVYHLASRAFGVAYSHGRHLAILRHNETITQNLLNAFVARPPRWLMVTSSSSVYPDDGPECVGELPVFTDEPEQANWGYGWSKRFLEQKTALFARETGTPVTIVRPFNVYGERYSWAGNNSQAMPMLVKRVMYGADPVVVWGSGEQRRSYIHGIDCARMMVALVDAGHDGSPVNLGTEETVSMRELVSRIATAGGLDPKIEADTSKPEGRFIKSADMSLFRRLVPDFTFEVSLDDGLRRMIDWYRTTDFPAED